MCIAGTGSIVNEVEREIENGQTEVEGRVRQRASERSNKTLQREN